MGTRTLTVELKIEVEDLSESERQANADGMGCEVDDLETVADTDCAEIGYLLASAIELPDTQDLLFSGADIFVRIASANFTRAEWID